MPTRLNYAFLLENVGRMNEAEIQYKLALKSDPDDKEVHYNYGLLLEKTGRLADAQKHFKRALEENR